MRSLPASTTCVRVACGVTALLAAGLLAGCSASSNAARSSSSPGASHATSTQSTSTQSTSTQRNSSPGPTDAATKTASSAPATASRNTGSGRTTSYCAESQLRAKIQHTTIPGNNTHGRRAVIVDFVNTSDSTCVLYGYPGAAVLNSSGKIVENAKRTIRGDLLGYAPGHNTLVNVRLAPGATANAGIEGINLQEQGAAQAGCEAKPNPQIEVTPPNTATPVPFDVSWPICYSLTVHPVNYRS